MKYKVILIIAICLILSLLYYFWNYILFFGKEASKFINYYVSLAWIKEDDDNMILVDGIRKEEKDLPEEIKNLKESARFVAGAPIDIYNDGIEYIFVGGYKGEHDALLKYDEKTDKMIDVIEGTGLDDLAATHAAVSIDLDKDGYTDLIVARQNGVFVYKNNKNGTFSKKKILEKKEGSTPLAITVSDYDKDGNPDIYVSQFIDKPESKFFQFHNEKHSKKNVFLKGLSDGSYIDITEQSGIDNKNNTFTSIFTDIDNDKDVDLININDTGKLGFFENIDNEIFKRRNVFDKYGSYMGVYSADIDFDGDLDYYFSNVGNTIQVNDWSRGNLKEDEILTHDHILLRNDGNFKFVDIGKEKGINNAGFSWGALFMDLNLDTYPDLLVSQNFDQIPTHNWVPMPGQRWMYNPKLKKYEATTKYKNPSVSQAPLSVDINRDGVKDIVWINMIGPVRIYKIPKNENNFINVKLPDTLDFANAKVIVNVGNKKYIKEYIIGGTGFASDMSQILQFGLGKAQKVDKITVETIYGNTYSYDNPKINSTIIVEPK